MKQPPKPTIKSVLDILLQFIKKQEKFNEEQREFNLQIQKEMREGFAKQEEFNRQIIHRIDNLVKINNLKE